MVAHCVMRTSVVILVIWLVYIKSFFFFFFFFFSDGPISLHMLATLIALTTKKKCHELSQKLWSYRTKDPRYIVSTSTLAKNTEWVTSKRMLQLSIQLRKYALTSDSLGTSLEFSTTNLVDKPDLTTITESIFFLLIFRVCFPSVAVHCLMVLQFQSLRDEK